MNRNSMMRETAYLSIISISLQGLGLLYNIFLTQKLGASSVGIFALIGSFFGLATVLSGGSGFLASSRFISEELGCTGNPARIFSYILRFCLLLSCSFCVLLCLIASLLTIPLHKTGASALDIRLLALCLPLNAVNACLKGRCYAYQKVLYPAIAEGVEFLIRAGVMAFCAQFLISYGRLSLLTAFVLSMLAGQIASLLFLLLIRIPQTKSTQLCSITYRKLLHLILPMLGNACLVSLLSSMNDALVPLTLLQFGSSPQEALSQFGEFEAIIIPTLFFPSVIQCSMSGLLVPELSRARASNDQPAIRRLTQRVLEQTVAFSLFIVVILWMYGGTIGGVLGGNSFTGHILRIMSPVVPLIYLEIIMEGILRGLGKQNFSSLNYLAEYIVRISVLLICVPLFGFYGIVASYLACNLSGNAVRLFFVLRATGLRPNCKRILFYPLLSVLLASQITRLILHLIHISDIGNFIVFTLICGGLMLFILRLCASFDAIEPRKYIKST